MPARFTAGMAINNAVALRYNFLSGCPMPDIGLLLRLAICFLGGSIPFAVLAMWGTGIDIRTVGSGNPGFNNVLRVSKPRAVITLLGDMGKGFLLLWLCQRPGDTVVVAWLYGFAAVLGHCYTPWLKFNGGKGIATSAGVMLMLYPRWAAVALTLFAVVRLTGSRLKWKEAGAIASLSAWVGFTLLALVFIGPQDGVIASLMTLLLAWRHKKNFQNLLTPA